MRRLLFLIASLSLYASTMYAQRVQDPKFEERIDQLISYQVPILSVTDVCDSIGSYQVLDAREIAEYEVSHIPGAMHIGYDDFDIKHLRLDRHRPILVYCSIGYRSDIIGGRLKKAGYEDVSNLFGSIFEWANQGYPLADTKGNPTQQLHTYNRKWSKWVTHPEIEKVW